MCPRRAGDPAALVAKVGPDPRQLWAGTPKYDNLEAIVEQALRWERSLAGREAA